MITLNRLKSRQHIEIVPDTDDDWFLHVNWVEKSNKIAYSCIIIEKDLKTWLTYLKNAGWNEKTMHS